MFIFEPLLSIFLPAIFAREVLNRNFKYDEGKQTKSIGFASTSSGNQAETDGLVKRLRNSMTRISLAQNDLNIFKSSLDGLKQFRVSYCTSICVQNFRCCMGRQSIKHYHEGKESFEKRLDIIKLITNSIDIEILKKLYLLPRQRNLFKK